LKEIPKVKRHEILYDVAETFKKKKQEAHETAKLSKEQEEMSKCTF